MNVQEALRRARQVVAASINPKMLASPEPATAAADREGAAPPASPRFDWVRPDGSVDAIVLGQTKEALELLMTDRAILHVGRITDLPAETASRHIVSTAIVKIVFERLDARRPIDEATLNAALAMFVEDVALVRRDAVDCGFVTRSADGRSYTLA
jgi:hypothetical protein